MNRSTLLIAASAALLPFAAQSAIAQCGIGLVLDQGTEVLAKAFHHLDRNVAQA